MPLLNFCLALRRVEINVSCFLCTQRTKGNILILRSYFTVQSDLWRSGKIFKYSGISVWWWYSGLSNYLVHYSPLSIYLSPLNHKIRDLNVSQDITSIYIFFIFIRYVERKISKLQKNKYVIFF